MSYGRKIFSSDNDNFFAEILYVFQGKLAKYDGKITVQTAFFEVIEQVQYKKPDFIVIAEIWFLLLFTFFSAGYKSTNLARDYIYTIHKITHNKKYYGKQ